MKSGVEVIPSARRMIRSLRDMGYEFAAAVADLVDNSIEAKASTVGITVEWAGASSYIMIADNGEGMTPDLLKEALRFGSERQYQDADLGKFGLGLKTASLSHCLKLTVASRWNPNRADINAFCWDVQYIEKTNRWEILGVKATNLPPAARLHLKEAPGTVVIWEQLDRLLDYKNPDGEPARKHLMAMTRDLEEHVAMVFHRFLAGEVRGKPLAIHINENQVEPWDPFARSEERTRKLDSKSFRLDGVKGRSDIVVEPYVLPPKDLFSSPTAFNEVSGPRKWNAQQGFYIYRADRMIQSGGWSGFRAIDEHRKLSRIAISFNPMLDDEFKINVPKMRVQLPAVIRDEIEKWIRPAVKLAEETYRKSKPKDLSPSPLPRQGSATILDPSPAPGSDENKGGTRPAPRPPTPNRSRSRATRQELDLVADLLIQVAIPEEVAAIENTISRARKTLEDSRV